MGAGLPDEGSEWMTPEVRDALMDIRGKHAAKKRATVIRIAFAQATGMPLREVFALSDTCNQRVWYQKWQYIPEVKRALELCVERALAWRDAETARLEAFYASQRRRLIAEKSLVAVESLAMTAMNREDRADYRTDAAMKLLSLADPSLAATERVPGFPVHVDNFGDLDAFIEQEMRRLQVPSTSVIGTEEDD